MLYHNPSVVLWPLHRALSEGNGGKKMGRPQTGAEEGWGGARGAEGKGVCCSDSGCCCKTSSRVQRKTYLSISFDT